MSTAHPRDHACHDHMHDDKELVHADIPRHQRLIWWRNRRLQTAAIAGILWVAALLAGLLVESGRLPVIVMVPSLASLVGVETKQVSLLPLLLYGAAIALGGHLFARNGLQTLVRTRTLGIDVLMTAAVLGAMSINEWAEGAAVVFLFSLGEGLESLTLSRTRRAIRALLDLSPPAAAVQQPAGTVRVPLESIKIGDVIEIRPGERIAMDGVVVQGASTVDQAPITGESAPVEKGIGRSVFAGTVNQHGYLEVRVTRRVEDTTLARIIHLVEEAQAQRAPSQRFVEQFATYYTPAVLAAAVLVATVPPLLFAQPFLTWFYFGLVLLVVSCPCALVISTPVSIVSALGNAFRHGVLIKGGAYLEAAGSLHAIAFDKTGTLTAGRPEVVDVCTLHGYEPEELVALAAAIEERSQHPHAAAILRRRAHDQQNGLCAEHGDHAHEHGDDHIHLYPHDPSEASLQAAELADFAAITGRGVRARLDGQLCFVGSPLLFEELGLDLQPLRETITRWQRHGQTALVVGTDEAVLGAIAVADRERPQARAAIAGLRAAGVEHITMLTGDGQLTAQTIARRLALDEFAAELLPEQKVGAIQCLGSRYGRVAMVGDGVNDAPALATADVGIAMGSAGSDTALETADIALMADDLTKLPYVISLSRRTVGIIRFNIAFALAVKALFIGLTFFGLASLWLAILADTGASLLVIANGMRLLGHAGHADPAGDQAAEVMPATVNGPARSAQLASEHSHSPTAGSIIRR